MKKYSKKIALILILALILVAAIPALAADTVIHGKYQDPDISVVVPDSVNAVINPLGLPVSIENGDVTYGKLTDPGQVATYPLIGYNLSEVKLDIGVTVVGKATGKFMLSSSAPAASSSTKQGQIYLQLDNAGDTMGYPYTLDDDTTAIFGKLEPAPVIAKLEALGAPDAYNATLTNQQLVDITAKTKKNMVTLDAATGDPLAPVANSFFIARLGGNVVKSPLQAWTTSDGVDVTITWEIEPTPTP